jgi:hypothetical protein
MTIYVTDERKADLKKRLRMSFKSRMVGEILDFIEDALTDFNTDEVLSQITAELVEGESIDNRIDTLVSAGILAGVSFQYDGPAAAANDAVMANVALDDGATQSITEGLTDPDVARQLKVVTTMADATLTGTVTITGTDVDGNAITEDVTLNNDDDVVTAKAFATVTQVDLPAWTADGDGIAIGTTAVLGSPVLLTKDTIYMALVDGAQDTLPTVTVHATDVAQVLIEPNTAPDGSKVFDFYYHA